MKDPYKILGLADTATQDEIKKTYRDLSKKYHPDKNPNGAEKFKEISEAYSMIDSEEKVQQYKNRSAGPFNWNADFEHIFGDRSFWGRGARNTQRNTFVQLQFTLEEFFSGTAKDFEVQVPTTCSNCGGRGAVAFDQTGRPIRSCEKCIGAGSTYEIRKSKVVLPRSVENGASLQCENGVVASVYQIPHDKFERRVFNTVAAEDIPLAKVFAGSKHTVETLHGAVELTLPKFLQNDQFVRVRGKGLFDFRKNSYGDHIIKVRIVIPQVSDDQCKKLLEILNDGKEETTPT